MDFLAAQNVTAPDPLRESLGLQSLRMGVVLPGDGMFFPSCCLIMERSTAANNLGVRCTTVFMNSRSHFLYKLCRSVYSACLVC